MSSDEQHFGGIIDTHGRIDEINDLEFVPDEREGTNQDGVGVDGLPIAPVEDLTQSQGENMQSSQSESEEKGFEEGSDKEKSEPEAPAQEMSLIAAVFNILNSVLGIGLLSVPNTFTNTGFVMSFVILLIVAALAFFASTIVIKLQMETNAQGLDALAHEILGKVGSVVLSVLSLFFLMCGLISYVIVAGDTLTSWFNLANIDTKPLGRRVILISVYAILLPVAMTIPRSVGFLKYFSTATIISLSFFMIAMIYKCIDVCGKIGGIHPTCLTNQFSFGLFSTLSTYAITFSMPVILIPVIRNFKKDEKKRQVVVIISTVICLLIVSVTGLTGYCMFGQGTNGNVLNNFNDNDTLIIIVRVAFFIVVTCAYPMLAQTVFGNWSELLFGVANCAMLTNGKRAIVLVIGNAIPILIAIFLSDLKPVIGIAGSLGGCIVNFMYPAILYIKHSNEKITSVMNILCILLAVFGLVCGVIATYVAIQDAINFFKS